MTESLRPEELSALIQRVFRPRPEERSIALLVDLPDERVADTPAWKQRREMVAAWAEALHVYPGFDLDVRLYAYRNAHTNNGELPPVVWRVDAASAVESMPPDAPAMADQPAVPLDEVLSGHPMIIAPTHFSATAPLKLAAKRHPFRAATMPGFSSAMIPALRLDYEEINRRVNLLKTLLDDATSARCRFLVDGSTERELVLDLRHRTAHASGGVFPDLGVAGNLPSGETYIVPYEGEREGDPSRTSGLLPVELEGEVVTYRVEGNRAVEVLQPDASNVARAESRRIAEEPAYSNIAELGLGVLDAFGVEPTGQILLDEKLGLHIAFGRSDHFGGQVGPSDFSSPDAVVHIDRVYVPRIQPRVRATSVDLLAADGTRVPILQEGRYVVDFGSAR